MSSALYLSLFLVFAFCGGADALRLANHRGGHSGGDPEQFTFETIPDCAKQVMSQYDPAPPPALKSTLPNVDAIFVMHYPPLKERRIVLTAELAKAGLNDTVTWVTWLNKGCDDDQEFHKCFFAHHPKKSMSAPVRSLSMKNVWVYTHMIRKGLKNAIVMEDDSAFDYTTFPNPVQSLNELVATVPHDYDFVHISGCKNFHRHAHENNKHRKINDHLYGPNFESRCTSGYLVSLKGATRMLEEIFKNGIRRPIDHQINEIGAQGGYWYEPYLWEQTELGGTSLAPDPSGGMKLDKKEIEKKSHSHLQCEMDGSC